LAGIIHLSRIIYKKAKLKSLSYWIYLLQTAVTTFVCGFGGASMNRAESNPTIHLSVLKAHAWTGMLAFLLSLIIAYYSYKSLKKNSLKTHDNLLLVLNFLFILVFVVSTILAFKLR
jgi:hypothetical protein